MRTVLWIVFPANREKYRELSQFWAQILPGVAAIMLNMRALCTSPSSIRP